MHTSVSVYKFTCIHANACTNTQRIKDECRARDSDWWLSGIFMEGDQALASTHSTIHTDIKINTKSENYF